MPRIGLPQGLSRDTAGPGRSATHRRVRGVKDGPDHAGEAPAWFERALAVPFTDEYVDVAGTPHLRQRGGGPGPLPHGPTPGPLSPYVLDHVARRSLRQVEGGWRWKFDRQVFAQFAGGMRSVALPYLAQVRCRLALLRSEHGLVT